MRIFAWVAIGVLWGTAGLPWWLFALLLLCGILIFVICQLLEEKSK